MTRLNYLRPKLFKNIESSEKIGITDCVCNIKHPIAINTIIISMNIMTWRKRVSLPLIENSCYENHVLFIYFLNTKKKQPRNMKNTLIHIEILGMYSNIC